MHSKILQQAIQAGRNLGQAGRNYGSIARDRGMDLLRNNPEYVGAAGLTGAIGGGIASQMLKDNDSFDLNLSCIFFNWLSVMYLSGDPFFSSQIRL